MAKRKLSDSEEREENVPKRRIGILQPKLDNASMSENSDTSQPVTETKKYEEEPLNDLDITRLSDAIKSIDSEIEQISGSIKAIEVADGDYSIIDLTDLDDSTESKQVKSIEVSDFTTPTSAVKSLESVKQSLVKPITYADIQNAIKAAIQAINQTTTDVPITTTDVPITPTDVPITTTDVPITTTDVPITTTDVPITTTDVLKDPLMFTNTLLWLSNSVLGMDNAIKINKKTHISYDDLEPTYLAFLEHTKYIDNTLFKEKFWSTDDYKNGLKKIVKGLMMCVIQKLNFIEHTIIEQKILTQDLESRNGDDQVNNKINIIIHANDIIIENILTALKTIAVTLFPKVYTCVYKVNINKKTYKYNVHFVEKTMCWDYMKTLRTRYVVFERFTSSITKEIITIILANGGET